MSLPLIIIAGPTAVGKTAVALELARRTGGAILSADSRQVYRGMSLGTAKPGAAECGEIEYGGIDLAEFSERFDAARFCACADRVIARHRATGRRTIIAGGTGLYLKSLLEGLFAVPEADPALRAQLEQRLEHEGAEKLHRELQAFDLEAAAAIHPRDRLRLTRALEVILQTGRPISALRREARGARSRHAHHYFVLNRPRPELYRRIEERVERMLAAGWLEEVAALKQRGLNRETPSCKALGYGPLLDVLERRLTLDEARALIKRDTRRYAKRQLTWFRRARVSAWIELEGQSAAQCAEHVLQRIDQQPPLD